MAMQELFGAYGRLQSVKFDANNGIAEVIYANKNDAIEAVSSYHNRNLDGMYQLYFARFDYVSFSKILISFFNDV